jgi:uncharacterized protein with von Willebrand factor type A (vWA) domain
MGSINWDIAIKAVTLLVLLGNTTATLVLFLRRRNDQRAKAMEERQEKFDEKLAQQGAKIGSEVAERKEESALVKQRLALAEQAIKTMPTHEDLRRISERLGELETSVASIDARTGATHETVNTIRDLLMEKGV